MKTTTTLFLSLILLASVGFANDEKYIGQMTKNIEAVYKAQTIEELQQAVNSFERIANAEKTKWEPYYYSAFGYIMMAFREPDGAKKDSLLDLAKAALEKATAINSGESEIVALEGFVYMARVAVDPATRGAQLSGVAMQTFGKSIGMNPENPRALSLMAQMQFGTAQFFNQEPVEACESAKKALALFEKDGASENVLSPKWGKEMTLGLLKNCK